MPATPATAGGLLPEDTTARVALATAGLSGHPVIADLIQQHGGATELVRFVHDHPDTVEIDEALVDRILRVATPATVAKILDTARSHNLRILTPDTVEWPGQVNDLGRAAPLVLFTHGDLEPISEDGVVITGDTAPSSGCQHLVAEIAVGLGDMRIPVITAAQPGVDQLAHQAARQMGGPVVVVSHDPRIGGRLEDITVVSENPPGSPLEVRAGKRARGLLAALGQKVLVAEAGVSSGAMQTGIAGHALGRPVGVIAETENQALGGGCACLHHLHGAELVHDVTGVQHLH